MSLPRFSVNQSLFVNLVSALIIIFGLIVVFDMNREIFPNVDFFSGIVYSCLDITPDIFTPIFAVSRVAGWTARVLEYLQNNRIFRPRAMYIGDFNKKFLPLAKRK